MTSLTKPNDNNEKNISKKKETSIYHVKGYFVEKNEKLDKIKPWTENMEKGMGAFGLSILKILTRYSMLNKACILKSVQSVNPTKWKKDMLPKVLRALRKADMVKTFQMSGSSEGDATLVIYCISEKGEEVLKKHNIETSDEVRARDLLSLKNAATYEEKEYITYNCTRTLALNQWHINMLYILGSSVVESYFGKFKVKDIVVPSMIVYRPYSAKTNSSKKLSIFAYAAPNDDYSIEVLARQLVDTFEFLSEPKHRNYRPGIIVILCENANHSAWVSWKFNQFRQLRQLSSCLYAIDITTNKERMLALLNECTADEIGIVRTGVNLE